MKMYTRLLSDFLNQSVGEKAGVIEIKGKAFNSVTITGLEYNSQNVKPGNLYFALPGLHADGHDFIPDAINRNAAAIVYQKELAEYPEGLSYIRVKDSRFAMSPIAASFYNNPSRQMTIIGITGTEGKSTTVYLIYQLLKAIGKKTGFISTVKHSDGLTEEWTSEHQTTPEAVTIHRLLAEMRDNGAEFAVVESSSHGLSKKTNRLGDVNFDAGVMTTVTHEHLEFHGTWEQYRSDKAELFRSLDFSMHDKPFGVVNADDKSAEYFAASTRQKVFSFSAKGADADLSIKNLSSDAEGNRYEVFLRPNGAAISGKTITIEDKLPGAFNSGNVLAALLVVSNLIPISVEELAPHIPDLKPVRGRMTPVCCGQPFEVIVDYAHTPSSFETVFPPLKKRMESSRGRLISVSGSAGERDIQKRKTQGEIAALYSDIVILADEDPRGEVPMAILEDIAEGCETAARSKKLIRGETLFLIPNRPLAIRKAVSLAGKGDLVLLLGKGHENSIIYASGTVGFDEISEAEAALKEAGY